MLHRLVLSMSNVKWFTVLSLFVIAALILGACQPFQPVAPGQEAAPAPSAQEPAPQPHQPRPDAPPYGVRGPYAVGVRDFVIEGKVGERPIPVSVWYPALNPDSRPEAVTYMLDFDNPDFPDFAVAGRALRDAAPNPSGGPYPLVVHSHGSWQCRQASVWLTEHLASYGFVVIAGDHEDNWGGLLGESESDNYVLRPQEISHQIDFAMTLGADDGALAGLIDAERVGVTGHSFGAETALLAGGARLNTNLLLNEWCAMYPGDPADVLNDCIAIPALLDKMVAMAGLDAAPEGLWPDWSDSRVDAVVSLASGAQYFGPEGLAALHVPVLLVESELDMFYGTATAYYQPYTLLTAGQKTHVVYERGNHMLFANNCEAMPGVVQQGLGWFCMDAVWDTSRAKDLANHFATAFLLAELKGDTEAATALAAENVTFPGIKYETTGYTNTATQPVEFVRKIDTSAQKITNPASLAVDGAGNVYVTDAAETPRVLKYDSQGNFVIAWGSRGSGEGQFEFLPPSPDDGPSAGFVATDTKGNVYVSDAYNFRVQKFDANGKFLMQFGSTGAGEGQFEGGPGPIYVDGQGNIYISTFPRVQKFDSTGKFLVAYGTAGTGDGEFTGAALGTLDSQGNMYVADFLNARVQKLDPNGKFLLKWGSAGTGAGQFNMPVAVVIDHANRLYVADNSGWIQVFTTNGEFQGQWSETGDGNPPLDGEISGLAIDGQDNIYVADLASPGIYVYRPR